MTRSTQLAPDPHLDLVLERVVDLAPELVWAAWTEPEHLKKWFAPDPWHTVDCEIDLRPGGIFRTVMRSPEGMNFPNIGCYLEVVPNQKLVWTGALLPGFRPLAHDPNVPFRFTAVISLEPAGKATKYTATVLHSDEEDRKKHEALGFHSGWGKALDQLVALMKK